MLAKTNNLKNVPPRQRVVNTILEQIFSGVLHAGASIASETEITRQTDVSRTAVREAIHLLKSKGILASKPKRGNIIQSFEQWNHLDADVIAWVRSSRFVNSFLEHVLEIRLVIEPQAAALAAVRASTSNMLTIERALEQMERAVGEKTMSKVAVMGDILFHESILMASSNMILIQFNDLFSAAIEMSIDLTFSQSEEIELSLKRHRELFEAIYQRNPMEARKKSLMVLKQSAKDFKRLGIPVRPDTLLVLGR